MRTYTNISVDLLYIDILTAILNNGIKSISRGLEYIELHPVTATLINPRARVILNSARKLSPFFLIGEFMWIMLGENKLDFIQYYNQQMTKFSDDGKTLYGAYGERLYFPVDQLEAVKYKLQQDLTTRQAVLVIANPNDIITTTKDFPCNAYLHFLVRENNLYLTAFVRSQDMLLGFPYDVFHWTLLQESLAKEFNLGLGTYTHIMSSCHIYVNDLDKIQNILLSGIPTRIMKPLTISFNQVKNDLYIAEQGVRLYNKLHTISDSFWNDFILLAWKKRNKDDTNNLFNPVFKQLLTEWRRND